MKKDYSGLERRSYLRIDEEDLLVCEPLDPLNFEGSIAKQVRAVTKSLSDNGLLIEVFEPYAMGALLKLQIDIKGWEKYKAAFYKAYSTGPQPFIVLGKVVRVEDIGDGRYEIGVAFIAVDSGHRLALKRYLMSEKKDQ